MVEIKMCRLLARVAIATGRTGGIVPAQSLLDRVNFKAAAADGFGLYGVSTYSEYSTVGNLDNMIAQSVRLTLGSNPQTVPTPAGR